jgi:sugar transferase (PEP-CTERM/EpsH1 system associated)
MPTEQMRARQGKELQGLRGANAPTRVKPVVAHVVLSLKVGGLERVVVNLVKGLRDSNYSCVVCCLETRGEFAADVDALGVPVHVFHKKLGLDFGMILRLAQFLREHSVKIIHTHNPGAHIYGLLAARLAGVPVRVHTRHGRNSPEDRKRVWINRILSWGTDVIVPVSDDASLVATNVEHISPKKVHRIWNGIDTTLYTPHHKPLAGPPVIGTVARLSPAKDQGTMLVAFRHVLEEIPDARLILAGDGPCSMELREEAARLGVNSHVEFLGQCSNVPEVLKRMSIFTLSSTTEGLPMTLLEAMAAGLPIVATDVGGNRELVQPPHCGLVVPARDPRALSRAYIDLLRDPQRCAQMGAASRARTVQYFSIDHTLSEYTKLYDQLMTRKVGRRTAS